MDLTKLYEALSCYVHPYMSNVSYSKNSLFDIEI